MEIKYSKKKEEIRRDPVLEFIAKAKNYLLAKSNTIMWIVIAACIVTGGVGIYFYTTKAKIKHAQEDFGRAMIAYNSGNESQALDAFKSVYENNKNTPHATYSAYIVGSILLRKDKFDEAINWFTNAATGKKCEFVNAAAYEGIAACYDAKEMPEEALKNIKNAVSDPKYRYRYPSLYWKAAIICKNIGKIEDAKKFCKNIVADTVAQAEYYKQKAENMLAQLNAIGTN